MNTAYNSKREIISVTGTDVSYPDIPVVINSLYTYLKLNCKYLVASDTSSGTIEIYDYSDTLVLSGAITLGSSTSYIQATESSLNIGSLDAGIYICKLKFTGTGLKVKYLNIHTI